MNGSFRQIAFSGVAVVSVLAACHHSTSMPATSNSVTIHLTVVMPQGLSGRIGPVVNVSVGGATIPLELDTGSTGIRVFASPFANAHGSYLPNPGTPDVLPLGTAGSSRNYVGKVVSADVQIGTIDLGSQHFQLVQQVCAGGLTSCPTSNEIDTEQAQLGADGLIGVRPGANNVPIYEPFGLLPSPYSSGFIVSFASQNVQIGISDADRSRFSIYQIGTTQPTSGPAVWKQTVLPWRVAINGVPFPLASGVLTDTGGQQAHLYFAGSSPPPGFMSNTLEPLGSGTTVMAKLGSISWAFSAGTCLTNSVKVWFGQTPPPSTTSSFGIDPYYDNDVLYDLENGAIGFRANSTTQVC